MELHFDLIQFERMKTIKQFYQRYHGCIRVQMPWSVLLKHKFGVQTGYVLPEDLVYIPNYEYGTKKHVYTGVVEASWKTGSRKPWKLGDELAIARVPALRVQRVVTKNKSPKQGEYFVLDGFHRLFEVKPCMVVIDFIDITNPADAKMFTDMHNEDWRPWAQ